MRCAERGGRLSVDETDELRDRIARIARVYVATSANGFLGRPTSHQNLQQPRLPKYGIALRWQTQLAGPGLDIRPMKKVSAHQNPMSRIAQSLQRDCRRQKRITLEEKEYRGQELLLALHLNDEYSRNEFAAEDLPGVARDRAGSESWIHIATVEEASSRLRAALNALDWVVTHSK